MTIIPIIEMFGKNINRLAKPKKQKRANIGWIGSPIYGKERRIGEKDKMKQQHIQLYKEM